MKIPDYFCEYGMIKVGGIVRKHHFFNLKQKYFRFSDKKIEFSIEKTHFPLK